jgi:hypothetical protein
VCRVLNWSMESERERSSHFPYSSWSPSRQRVSKANQALLEYPEYRDRRRKLGRLEIPETLEPLERREKFAST